MAWLEAFWSGFGFAGIGLLLILVWLVARGGQVVSHAAGLLRSRHRAEQAPR